MRIDGGFVPTADGSCLIEMGRTRVICTACIVPGLPRWREKQRYAGWLTAEYGMLPASTRERKGRPIGRPDGRSAEIQRLIGRALRAVVRLEGLGQHTVYIDCDVVEADGGTRAASVTGAWVALCRAAAKGIDAGTFRRPVLTGAVAAVSVGVIDGRAVLDPDYQEDLAADVDMNVAMTNRGRFVEVQGSAEKAAFGAEQLDAMLGLARRGIRKLLAVQREAVRRSVKR